MMIYPIGTSLKYFDTVIWNIAMALSPWPPLILVPRTGEASF